MAEENGTSLLGGQGNTETPPAGEGTLLGGQQNSNPPADGQTPPAEGQKSEPKPGEEKPGDKQEPVKGAPEKYADFVLPEGIAIDKPLVEEFVGVAKTLGLSQENAQKLVDIQAKAAKSHSEQILSQFNQTTEDWKKATKKELGADYQKELGIAAKAIGRFGTQELKDLLNDTGVGNHPEVVKVFIKIGKLISEDGFVDGKKQGQTKTDGEIFYPNMKK